MTIKLTQTGCSNWEFAAFYLIEPFVDATNRKLFRTQMFKDQVIDEMLELLINVLKHKKNPQHPRETLQRTLQNMRDKGWVQFLDNRGNYELTDKGWEILSKNKGSIRELRSILKKR